MAAQIIWTSEAYEDVDSIAAYIFWDSAAYSANVIDKILATVRHLPENPFVGRKVPEWEEDTIREVFAYNYRIIYQVVRESIHILAIIHTKRYLDPIIEKRLGKTS